jgi:predicted ferric reductase/Ca2+-binding EF-hand superfamily protein
VARGERTTDGDAPDDEKAPRGSDVTEFGTVRVHRKEVAPPDHGKAPTGPFGTVRVHRKEVAPPDHGKATGPFGTVRVHRNEVAPPDQGKDPHGADVTEFGTVRVHRNEVAPPDAGKALRRSDVTEFGTLRERGAGVAPRDARKVPRRSDVTEFGTLRERGGYVAPSEDGGSRPVDSLELSMLRAQLRAAARNVVPADNASSFVPVEMPRSAFIPNSLPASSNLPLTLDPALLARVHQCFKNLAGPESVLDAEKMKRCLRVESVFLAERMLAVFDKDRDGLVNRVEFVRGVPRLLFGSMRDKLRFVFRLHDIDGDGYIDHEELVRMMQVALTEDGVNARPEVAQRLSDLLFAAADGNRDGKLSFSDFEKIAAEYPEATALIFPSEASWIAPRGELTLQRHRGTSLVGRLARYLDNRPALVLVVTLWLLANAALFANAVVHYRALGMNELVQIARGSGACINLNGALILLPMARGTLTFARRVPLLRFLPLDDSVAIHRWLGGSLLLFSLVHTLAHGANWATSSPGLWASFSASAAGWTGLALLLVFGVIWVFSRPRVRASKHFELFYWTHLLYIVWFALALVHGRVFWMWAGIPLAIFAADRLLRLFRSVPRTEVFGCEPLASGVTKLTLERPEGFKHRAGDYLYLKLPALARYEWHPFTISSAPEQSDLTLHVRSLGNFTNALHDLARERSRIASPPILTAQLDGPFGTATQRIFESRHAVLIGAGIGVTPFASLLESIVLRGQAGEGALEKVHFYWLNRDPVSFEWFAKLLACLERDAPMGLVDIRIFMTGGRGNMTSTLLHMAREIAHELGDPDVVTGLASMTRVGAPDWRAELSPIARDFPDAEVFFCGPPGLGRTIRGVCNELGLGFQQEHF